MPIIVHRPMKLIEEMKEEKEIHPFDFTISQACRVDYILAAEDNDYEPGEAKSIRINKVMIPKNTLILISPYGRHGMGQVVSIGEKIAMPVELERSADYALFVAGVGGTVHKNELIGVIMLVPITPHKKKKPQ